MASAATDGSSYVCPASAGRQFPETEAAVFQNTAAINGGRNIPRFGHTDNMTVLVEVATNGAAASDEEMAQMRSYLLGLVSAAILIFAFFCFWVVLLLVLKCLGYRRVGFFSGSNIEIPPKPTEPMDPNQDGIDKDEGLALTTAGRGGGDGSDDDEHGDGAEGGNLNYKRELEIWKAAVQVRETRQRRIRITVLLCGLLIVVMCVLFLVFGVRSLNQSYNSIREGLRRAEDQAMDAVYILDNFTIAHNGTLAAVQTLDETDFCGPILLVLCPLLTQQFGLTFTDGDCQLNGQLQSFIQSASDTLMKELDYTRSDALEIAQLLDALDNRVGSFVWAFWVAAAVAILLMILTIFIMSGVILAWQNKLHGNCIQKFFSGIRGWLIVPIFIFLVVLGWIFSMVFVIGSAANADWCYNSPNEKVMIILNQMKDNLDSLLFQLIVYYISGCPESGLVDSFYDQLKEILAVLTKVSLLSTLLVDGTALIGPVCPTGREARAMYNGVCYQATAGFSWSASTQLAIVFFSMIILTLRVGFFEMVDEGEKRGCCGRRQQQDNEMGPGAQDDLVPTAPDEGPADQQPPEEATAGAPNNDGRML